MTLRCFYGSKIFFDSKIFGSSIGENVLILHFSERAQNIYALHNQDGGFAECLNMSRK